MPNAGIRSVIEKRLQLYAGICDCFNEPFIVSFGFKDTRIVLPTLGLWDRVTSHIRLEDNGGLESLR